MTDEAGARFAELSRRTCAALERGDVRTTELQSLLAEIVVASIALPDKEPDDERAWDLDPHHRRISLRLQSEGLAAVDVGFYWSLVDPLEGLEPPGPLPDVEATLGSFADDLGDIYAGLAEGLQTWDGGRLDEAIWLWRYGCRSIWGRDICDALRVLWQVQQNTR